MDENAPPFSHWLGGTIREANKGAFTVEFTVRPEMTNPLGVLHGGIHAAIIDDMIGMTVYTLGSETYYLSVNLTVDFLGRAKVGDKVMAKSQVIRQGAQIANAVCEIFDAKNNLISRGTSNLLRTNIPI